MCPKWIVVFLLGAKSDCRISADRTGLGVINPRTGPDRTGPDCGGDGPDRTGLPGGGDLADRGLPRIRSNKYRWVYHRWPWVYHRWRSSWRFAAYASQRKRPMTERIAKQSSLGFKPVDNTKIKIGEVIDFPGTHWPQLSASKRPAMHLNGPGLRTGPDRTQGGHGPDRTGLGAPRTGPDRTGAPCGPDRTAVRLGP